MRARGKGSRRIFAQSDLVLLKAAGVLRRAGIVGDPFARAIEHVRRIAPEDMMTDKLMVVRPSRVDVMTSQELAGKLPTLESCVVILPLRELSLGVGVASSSNCQASPTIGMK